LKLKELREEEPWDDWLIYGDDGYRCGIRTDAPDDIKKTYERFVEEQEKQKGPIPK
jgi:hypothetical protein